MLILWRRFIAVGATRDIPALFLFRTHCCFYFGGQVFAVIIIDEISERHIHTNGLSVVVKAVVMVIDGLEADAQKRKDVLQIFLILHREFIKKQTRLTSWFL